MSGDVRQGKGREDNLPLAFLLRNPGSINFKNVIIYFLQVMFTFVVLQLLYHNLQHSCNIQSQSVSSMIQSVNRTVGLIYVVGSVVT